MTDRPQLSAGDPVEVNEPGLRPWAGRVTSVKPTPRHGWYVEVLSDEGIAWAVPSAYVKKG
jgi:hypothetical protein